ncbi:MAG: 3-hydroxybutyryl-CoA dehydrogenase [Chloracidobacterium sp.]|nr:3-hydroxybutyryl-CoA dehydrogenase [Chloracidobacterium sp.]MDW8218610.1 3-hydroxybutyryl-CoA dehydrogenase [Acidobacteriota bacterium]
MTEFRKIGVVGCGTMGAGITQTILQAGYEVVVVEADDDRLQRGFTTIVSALSKLVEKGVIADADKDAAQQRLRGTTELSALANCDLVIEAVVEDLNTKQALFRRLDELCRPETIFASNTSSLSITHMASVVSPARQARFVGLHFFNPVPRMALVEVVRSFLTDAAVVEQVTAFARAIGKTPVQATDKTGFIVNRLLVPYSLDAIRALEEGVGSITDIDQAMKLGAGHPMGPLMLNDLVGLDVLLSVANAMYEAFRERRFAPPPLLTRMVAAGWLGRKTGRGFYDYSDPKQPKPMALV